MTTVAALPMTLSTSTNHQPELLVKVFNAILSKLLSEEGTVVGGKMLRFSETFKNLPSKRDYPEYYVAIKQPISLSMIHAKIEKHEYHGLEDLRQDMGQLVLNAITFNQRGSDIYELALALRLAFEKYSYTEMVAAGLMTEEEKLDHLAIWEKFRTATRPSDRGVLCEIFFDLPDENDYPDYYIEIKEPIALNLIKQRITKHLYPTNASLERDLRLMVSNAKAYNAEGSQVWEDACEIEYIINREFHRISDRPVSLEWNGHTLNVGDWVYIHNPNNPQTPTIVQIFDVKNDGRFQGNWYLRPAQTVHKATTKFMPKEVFKTSHMQMYDQTDILKKCAVLFYKDFIRGKLKGVDPKDVYVCESRYNEAIRSFTKIKSWSSCLPDQVRGLEPDLDLYPGGSIIPTRVVSEFSATASQDETSVKNTSKRESMDATFSKASTPVLKTAPQSFARAPVAAISPVVKPIKFSPRPSPIIVHFPPVRAPVIPTQPPVIHTGPTIPAQAPFPDALVECFERKDGAIKWFPAPPIDVCASQVVTHSLAYLRYKSEKRQERTERAAAVSLGSVAKKAKLSHA